MVKTAVTFGAACGVASVLAVMYATMVIMNDINAMYDDVMGELGGFRVSHRREFVALSLFSTLLMTPGMT